MKFFHEAEEIREKELKNRAEDSSALGDGKVTLSYENLIEHEKSRSQWRKIKYVLKQGITEPLTRLLYQDSQEGPAQITTNGEEIQNKIIDQSIKHSSTAEESPLGIGSFLHKAIKPHGTSDFCDRALDGGLGPTDKEEINFTEEYELLQHMERKKYLPRNRHHINGLKIVLATCSNQQRMPIWIATLTMKNLFPVTPWTRHIH